MLKLIDPDEQFFRDHPDRKAHIREPKMVLAQNRQRAVRYEDECRAEFLSLGDHDVSRRRIVLWKIPPGNPRYDPAKIQVLKIPFLAFADETIEDRDDILLPIVHEIMLDAAAR